MIEADDGKQYVIKLIGNDQGTRILANEYVVGKLAELLGTPSPPVGIVNVDEFIVNSLNSSLGTRFQPGPQFASSYLGGENVEVVPSNIELMRNASNANMWPFVVLLDSLVQNTDRTQPQHVLISRNRQSGELRFWAIDHGHCLGVAGGWTTLRTDHMALRPLVYGELVKGPDDYRDALNALRNLTRDQVDRILDECPLTEWEVPSGDRSALLEYLEAAKMKLRAK